MLTKLCLCDWAQRTGGLIHLFGRYTQVPVRPPIKHAEVFNPTLPFVMLLSFIPLGLQVLTAIWQCQAVTTDATGSKGHFFILRIKQVLIFHSLWKNIKKREGDFRAPCQIPRKNVPGSEVTRKWDAGLKNKEKSWILKPQFVYFEFKIWQFY